MPTTLNKKENVLIATPHYGEAKAQDIILGTELMLSNILT